MTNETSNPNEKFGSADRPPSEDEESAAERGAEEVDTDEVGEHEDEMNERGANAEGEGKIVP